MKNLIFGIDYGLSVPIPVQEMKILSDEIMILNIS